MTPVLDFIRSRRVESFTWYHSIPLGDSVTPGMCPLSVEKWTASAMAADLTGRTVLDIGAWDGYFSFEAERRGAARVLAIDSLAGPQHEHLKADGFEHARAFLNSRVEFKVMDVADISELQEKFDLILFLGVYYHLRDPIHALRLIFDRLRPGGDLLLEGLVLPGSEPKLRLLRPEDLEPTTYCVGTLKWLEACFRQTGFASVELAGGTWRIRDAMRYYAETLRSWPARGIFAIANRVAWSARLKWVPLKPRTKMYRVLLRATKPSADSRSDS